MVDVFFEKKVNKMGWSPDSYSISALLRRLETCKPHFIEHKSRFHFAEC